MKNIVWLASYPKSGNTWFRAFLSSLINEKDAPVDINRLDTGSIFSARPLFDKSTSIQASDLLPDEIDDLRPGVYKELSLNATKTLFIKAHDAYTYLANNQPLFPTEVTKGAIYLLRNPLDVAPSFANHSSCSIDEIITRMNSEDHAFCDCAKNLTNQLRQQLFSWSGHVRSWLNATEIDVHFVRYEDMKTKPLETFRAAIRFAGFDHSDKEILKALDDCAFEKLQAQEKETGFREKSVKVAAFFRKGVVGSWQDSLSVKQAKTLIRHHADMMKHFKYLDQDDGLTPVPEICKTSRKSLGLSFSGSKWMPYTKYHLFGLTISLPFEFDELAESDEEADVTVSLQPIDCGNITWEQESICYKAKPGLYLLSVAGVAHYLVKSGREIIIDIEPNADMDAVRLLLLNPVVTILLIQRGMVPFSGSCVVYQDRAFALIGRSSVGKSFFAAGLKQKGFQILSDGHCVLGTDTPFSIYPGYPFLMLWHRGLMQLGEKIKRLKPVRKGLEKYIYPLNDNFYKTSAPLAGIYLLSANNETEFIIESLSGVQSMFKILDFICNEPLFKMMGQLKQQHKVTSAVAKTVPIKQYIYSITKDTIQGSIDFLEQEIKKTSRQAK